MEFNFLRYNLNKIDHLGADYDTCSIMHYGEYAFSKVKRTKFNWEKGSPQPKIYLILPLMRSLTLT